MGKTAWFLPGKAMVSSGAPEGRAAGSCLGHPADAFGDPAGFHDWDSWKLEKTNAIPPKFQHPLNETMVSQG